jgi:hypothetical protein
MIMSVDSQVAVECRSLIAGLTISSPAVSLCHVIEAEKNQIIRN